MNKIFQIAAALLIIAACSPKIIQVPVNTDTHVEYRDSVIYKTDTVKISVPVERIKEVVPALDTLKMETSVATATAYLDTATASLKGVLENKKTDLKKEQIALKEKISYRDSVTVKEIPIKVPVEKVVKVVPLFWRIFAVIGILAVAFLTFWIIFKLK